MRAVLDTNILTRAVASPTGPAGEVFDLLCAGHLLVTSTAILTELERVLTYPRVRKLHDLDDAALNTFLSSLVTGSLVVTLPDPIPKIGPDDPDDDSLVATAVAGSTNVFCTRNRHLFHPVVLEFCQQRGIAVMDDLELLSLLRSQPGFQSGGN